MNIKYAGIGSRSTPEAIQTLMKDIAERLAIRGWTLRSGGADGADKAFENGCDIQNGKKEIFIPWNKFNGSSSSLFPPSDEALMIACKIHPAWKNLSGPAKLLHARNCHQILGQNLDDPVSVVICWTQDGKVVGGTATAIKIAEERNIPVLNLALSTDIKEDILKIENKV